MDGYQPRNFNRRATDAPATGPVDSRVTDLTAYMGRMARTTGLTAGEALAAYQSQQLAMAA